MKFLIVLFFSVVFLFPSQVLASIGVGVGTGKIQVDEKLKPGIIYELPPLTVINTGDEASEYEVNISYHEGQPELKPQESWFILSPKTFQLEPGATQVVDIKLNLPIRAEPGNYFAYLEGHPFKKSVSGNTVIGVAAAAKLYFTVVPANPIAGIFYKMISFWNVYAPWPQRVAIGLVVVIALAFFKKFFNIQVNVKKPDSHPHPHSHEHDHDHPPKANE